MGQETAVIRYTQADRHKFLLGKKSQDINININKLEWAELNQAEAVRLHVYAKLRFQV